MVTAGVIDIESETASRWSLMAIEAVPRLPGLLVFGTLPGTRLLRLSLVARRPRDDPRFVLLFGFREASLDWALTGEDDFFSTRLWLRFTHPWAS